MINLVIEKVYFSPAILEYIQGIPEKIQGKVKKNRTFFKFYLTFI